MLVGNHTQEDRFWTIGVESNFRCFLDLSFGPFSKVVGHKLCKDISLISEQTVILCNVLRGCFLVNAFVPNLSDSNGRPLFELFDWDPAYRELIREYKIMKIKYCGSDAASGAIIKNYNYKL